jgi:hypothetical protein
VIETAVTIIRSLASPLIRITARHRTALSAGLALAGIALLALSAYHLRPQPPSFNHYRPTHGPTAYYDGAAHWTLLAGTLAMLGALVLSRRFGPFPRPVDPDRAWVRPRWLAVVAGAAALAAFAEINGGLIGLDALAGRSPEVQIALLAAGSALLAWGLGGAVVRWPGWSWEAALVAALAWAALAVRVWDLGSSVRTLVDEGHFAHGTMHFLRYPDIRLLEPMPTAASFPFIFSYGQSVAVALLGRDLFGLRAFSALLGALTVPALYLLARQLYDRTTALLAALVLLTFPTHVHYSRLALNNIADPLFGTLALAGLACGLRTGRPGAFAWGGAALGLTQYFYDGGRLLYPALAFGWLAAGLIVWRPRPPWRGIAIAGLAFALVAAPVYLALVGLDFPLFNRLDKMQFNDAYWTKDLEPDTLGTRLAHFEHSLLFYVSQPENTLYYYFLYYGGRHPLILEVAVPAFLLGMILAAWRWRTPGALPVPWVLGTSAGNALLIESAVSARYVVVFPALALLIAVGARYTLPLIWPARRFRAAQTGLLVALAGALAVGQAAYYFGPFLDLFNVEARQHVRYDADDALLRAADFPPGTQVHIIAENVLPQTDAQHLLDFLADGLVVRVEHPGTMSEAYFPMLSRTVDHAFFVPPDDPHIATLIAGAFGAGLLYGSPYDVPPEKMLWLYYLPADPSAPADEPAVG